MVNTGIPLLKDIEDAHRRIEPYIHRTPVMHSAYINSLAGAELYFKCENFQKAGAFKYRGATNAILRLSEEERSRGVITHSSGNHAAALSLAARRAGIKAYIVVPSTSTGVKKAAIKSYGAEMTLCEPNLDARIAAAEKIIERTGASFIHPYDNFNVICGQGTATLELMQDHHDLDMVVCPVGGGGLLSGTAIAARGIKPGIKVFAAEPLGADDTYRSFKAGSLIKDFTPATIADGLLTTPSERNFKIIMDNVEDVITVTDEEIINAMWLIWERMKIVVEPSSTTTLAAILKSRDIFGGKKLGVILSGGNVDLGKLPFNR